MEKNSIFKKGFLVLLCALVMLSTVSAYIPRAIAASNGIFASSTSPIFQLSGSKVKIDSDLVISIPDQPNLDSATVIISNFKQGDILHFVNENGITGHYNSTNGVLSFNGVATIENYQAILRKLEFSTTSTDTTERNITISIGNALYFEPTQHFYEFVPAQHITWTSAKDAAEKRSLYGRQGYLATVTSESENNFIKEKTTGQGWLGASDSFEAINAATGESTYTTQSLSEGNWYWVTGPEKGTPFWKGTGSGSSVSGQYSNWMTGEPNNQGDEHYAHIFGPTPPSWGKYGKWNDFADTTEVNGYIVEYGGLATDSINDIQLTMTKQVKIVEKLENSKAPTASDIHFNSSNKTVEIVNAPADTTVALYINNVLANSMISSNGTAMFEGLQVQNGDILSVTFTEPNKLESDKTEVVLELPVDLNLGFEKGLTGWTSYGEVTASITQNYTIYPSPAHPTGINKYQWTVKPYQMKMAVLIPSGYEGVHQNVFNALHLSTDSQIYILKHFPSPTNFAYIYQDIELKANEKITMSWNYIATDYEPFNDASFTSLVYLGNDNPTIPTINGAKSETSILGATVKGTGNYSTGSYGSTGWQVATYKVDKAGSYRLGFAVYNLDDTALNPYLFVDKEPGETILNGNPIVPIEKDPEGPDQKSTEPKSENILVNATDKTVTVKNVPANTTVKLYKGDQLIDTKENTSGEVTFTDVQVTKGEEIQVTFTEKEKTESDKTSKLAQVRSENLLADSIVANATKDTVIVKDVPTDVLITVYDESGKKIGEFVQTNDIGDVEISISTGLEDDQSIKLTIIKPGEIESNGTTVVASIEQTVAPSPSAILINATDKIVQIEGVPANTTINLYKDGEKTTFYTAENESGNVTLNDLAIEEGEIIQVTYTAPDHLESVKVDKKAQVRSEKIASDDVFVNSTTNVVHVQNVDPGATIIVYDTDGITELGRATNDGNETDEVSVILYDTRIQEGDSLHVSLIELEKLESEKTSVYGTDTDDVLKHRYLIAGGNEEDHVFSTVVSTEATLTSLIDQDPSNKEEIKSTVTDLQDAITKLEEAVIAKELENAIKAAESAKAQAETAKNRFDQAGGEESETVYQELEEALQLVNKELTKEPKDITNIILTTATLTEKIKDMNDASADKELKNALEAAKLAKEKAEKAKERYIKANGDTQLTEYQAILTALSELDEVLNSNASDVTIIQEATQKLVTATKKLEIKTAWKELSNAMEAAEQAKTVTDKAIERYNAAHGDVNEQVYKAVTKAIADINALPPHPQYTEAFVAGTEVLVKATLELEKASVAKELSNAVEAAEKAKTEAEKAQDRYETAKGDLNAKVYEAVVKAVEELNKALAADPQDTKAIEAATAVLVKATQELEKASAEKELSNAIEAAEKAKVKAEKAQDRYEAANGDVNADVFENVKKAIEDLDKALTAKPQDTKKIETATDVLTKATQELEKASAEKELSNAIEAAEKAKVEAGKAQDRYEAAKGNVDAKDFKNVKKAIDDINKALTTKPQDTKAIEAATKVLNKATQELEKASAAKELSNAIEAAEKAKAEAKKAQSRYEAANGDMNAEVFKNVKKAIEELNKALTAKPQNTKSIETATEVLNKATQELEKASTAKELSNAIEAAEKAKTEVKKAQDRYEAAKGNVDANVYEAVAKAIQELNKALATKPQNTKTIEAATDVLNKATQELEKASAEKELSNAIEAAEKAKAEAKKAQSRYEAAKGDMNADVFENVKKAIEELDKALTAKPQDTKKIEKATDVLNKAIQELEKASASKELSNAIAAAEKAKLEAKKAQDRYKAAQGDVNSKAYEAVEKAIDEVNKALAANPQDTKAIEATTVMLNKAIEQLQNQANGLIKKSILEAIKSLTTIQDAREIKVKIETSGLPETDKKEGFRKLADTILKQNSSIILKQAFDINLVKESIDKSDKTVDQKQQSYIALAEKAIDELSKRDYPTNQHEFQTDENRMIDTVIKSVTNHNEQSSLSKTHKAVVDVLSLTKDNAFTFTKNDTWESITSQFLLLSKGYYGTPISWNSTNTSIVTIANNKAAIHRQEADKTVILTAKLSTGSRILEKTFLLVIKSQRVATKVVESTRRETTVTNGSNVENTPSIQRINLIDKNSGSVVNKIDKIVVDSTMIPTQTNGPISIYLPDDQSNLADELAIEMPFDSITKLTDAVYIRTDQGTLFLSAETIQRIQADGIDLFFRIVPVRDSKESAQIADRTMVNQQVKATISELNGDTIKVLGTPREIETNYKGYDTEIILPLEDVLYEGVNLDNLHVYIEHSDGEKEVVKGEIVKENGKPVGIKFSVNKFSTFTIFEVVSNPVEQPQEESKSPDSVGVPNTDKAVLNDNKAKDKELPKTATTQYNSLLFGLLVSILGLVLFIFTRRKTVKK